MNSAGLSIFFCAVLCVVASAQRDPGYDRVVAPQTRIDLRDLGYSPVDLIPDGESGVTSLSVAPNGDIYGATSGTRSHLFMMNPAHGYVFPIGVIPNATSVTHSIVISEEGHVFIGTTPEGHLLEYTPDDFDHKSIEIGKILVVTDRGAPVPGESIFALAVDRKANRIYGLTYPNAHVFSYAIATHTFLELGVVAKTFPWAEKSEHEKIMSRMLAVDNRGDVFVTGEDGNFYEVDGKEQTLRRLPIRAPAVPGREPYTRVDAFLVDTSGVIYGGTSDGYLFRLIPETRRVTNLGKPLNQYRIAGLAQGANGKLYGVGGDESEMARLFSYDPTDGAYDLLGFIDVNRRPYFTWQAYVIGDVVSDSRGTVFLGENERISKLFLFFPY